VYQENHHNRQWLKRLKSGRHRVGTLKRSGSTFWRKKLHFSGKIRFCDACRHPPIARIYQGVV
jgi:hypothetical protein